MMNNQDIVSDSDRISELPEALILQILSHLPTKVAISTSILSKQWKSLWKVLPNLKFDIYKHSREVGTFTKNVCKALLLHKAPVLQSLELGLERCNAVDTGVLIGIAFARNVRKLILEVFGDRFTFPESLYHCETLETLELRFKILMDVPSSVCLKSLRTLNIYFYVDFKDEESVVNLLSGCPNLETLVVRGFSSFNVKTFTIAVPSLQRLSISTPSDQLRYPSTSCVIVINAPSLKYLTIGGPKALESCLVENVPELVEANINDITTVINEKLLGYLIPAKRLSLALLPFQNKFPVGGSFYQLVYLELYTNYAAWGNLLTLMLDSSPKLQVLKLFNDLDWRRDFLPLGKWSEPKKVPECLLLHLDTFVWEGYEWEREDEIHVAKYILSNTKRLKRATFSAKHMIPTERIEMVENLNTVVRASTSCQLQVKWKKI